MTSTKLKPLIEKEVLTLKPSTLLNLTLAPYLPKSKNFNSTLKFDTPLPYNYHLAYFFSQHLESKLANDGYDLDLFSKSRRIMWHSGRLLYTHNNLMKYGQEVSCQTSTIKEDRIISSNYKKELVKVMKQKEYFNQMGHSMTEIRSLVYFDGEDRFHMKVKENGKEIEVEKGEMKFSLITNPILLFRYSALTFNAHQIHYNSNYAKMEGYQDCLVHGPLTITFVLKLMEHFKIINGDNRQILDFNYQLIYPLLVNQQIHFYIKKLNNNQLSCKFYNQYYQLCGKCTAILD